uniref:Uncharacterized protein n=1 Tax=uncultured prokaryote TaxID=198431 RepID=A0A0H5Q7G3_9ZZZZ|nr:hypothetical protein [uncultured prokaryote]
MGKPKTRAKSLYRQLRLTATQELNGRFSYSIYAKPLNAQWSEHSLILRASIDIPDFPLNTTEDVVVALVAILEGQFLPPDGDSN